MPVLNISSEQCNIENIFNLCKLDKNSIFIDLGANIGQQVSFLQEKNIKTIAFEPHPKIFQILKKNVESKKNKEVIELHQKAAWLQEGEFNLFFKNSPDQINGGASLIYEKTNIYRESAFKIKGINFSNFLKKLDKEIEVLKIDIEGSEYHLIEDLIKEETIHYCKNLFVEDHERKIFKNSIFYKEYIQKREKIIKYFEKSKICYYNWK